jgi:curli production assembly/transport component CsgG
MMRRRIIIAVLAVNVMCFGGCAEPGAWSAVEKGSEPAAFAPLTESNQQLRRLPPAAKKIRVAVYGFSDQTGQMKASDAVQTLSRAVTQGGASILVKALLDAGNGEWFQVVEREKINNLLREREIIAETRKIYYGENAINWKRLPPMMSADILLDGGIIGYDVGTTTGGVGAQYLGLGGEVSCQQHMVTISLRAISTRTGKVLSSVLTRKTVLLVSVEGGAYKYASLANPLMSKSATAKTNQFRLRCKKPSKKLFAP